MKPNYFLLLCILIITPCVMYAQEDYCYYLVNARKHLDNGDCARAANNYDMYKKMTNLVDMEIEQRIAMCSSDDSISLEKMSDDIFIHTDSVLTINPDDSVVLSLHQSELSNSAVCYYDKTQYSLGDIYCSTMYGTRNFIVGYLDFSKKHGIAYYIDDMDKRPGIYIVSGSNERTPEISELEMLYRNREYLDLYGEYWSGEGGSQHREEWNYTFDFSTGKKHKRDWYKHYYWRILIMRF